MTKPTTLESLPLHDSVLLRVELLWEERICRLYLHAFAVRGQSAQPHLLQFNGLTRVHVPLDAPWGPSSCINAASGSAQDGFTIEMQSGDVLQLSASGFEFRADGLSA